MLGNGDGTFQSPVNYPRPSTGPEASWMSFGSTTIPLGTIAVTGPNAGDFPIQNQRGSTLATGQHCTVGIVLKPSDKNGCSATLSIPNNTLGLGQPVSLFGPGTFVGLAPLSSNFGDVPIGHTSAPQTITLTNTGSARLNISSIKIKGTDFTNFSQTHNCGSSVPGGGSCTIRVTFTPSATGACTAGVAVTGDGGPQQGGSLSGTGT